jgi:hypothetical protein
MLVCRICHRENKDPGGPPESYACGFCRNRSLVRVPKKADSDTAVGLIGGALVGAAIGGPTGALVGGLLGLIIGSSGTHKPQP